MSDLDESQEDRSGAERNPSRPRPTARRLSNPFLSHGDGCRCPRLLTLDQLPIRVGVRDAVGEIVGKAPHMVRVDALLRLESERVAKMPEAIAQALVLGLAQAASGPCPTRSDFVADVGWRTYSRPGLQRRAERWPDDWDGVDWMMFARTGLGVPGEWYGRPLREVFHASLEEIISQRPRSPREKAEVLLANHHWLWNVSPDFVYEVNPDDWTLRDRVRVLGVLRADYSAWERDRALSGIATVIGRGWREILFFADYIDACDRQVRVADDATRAVLERYPQSRHRELLRRTGMMYEFDRTPPDPGDLLETDVSEALDAHLELPVVVPIAAEDGQPDPLETVRRLLPGGAGVRGKPPIVYSPTELDRDLLPRLTQGEPTLVVLSGNAGDGKTAFVTSVLEAAGVSFAAGQNEYLIDLEGHPYLVVLDGSEDAEARSNEDLLASALGGFRGANAVAPSRGTVIAVNKGRLLDFLERHSSEYAYLWMIVRSRFVDGAGSGDEPYVLIDLNDRSVIGPQKEASLFTGVLSRLATWSGWDSCEQCDARAACPALFNIQSLAKPVVADQLWRIFAGIDLDDRVHVTARHLVTKVASTVAGDLRCPDVRRRVADGGGFDSETYFYNSVFSGSTDQGTADQAVMDRISASYDPSDLGSPRADRQIAFHVVRGSLEGLLGNYPGPDVAALGEMAAELEAGSIDSAPEGDAPEFRTAMIRLAGRVARRLFFFEPTHELAPPFPLRAFEAFRGLVDGPGEALTVAVSAILESLNATLGIDTRRIDGLVVPKDYGRGLGGTGIAMVVPAAQFRLTAGDAVGGIFVARPFIASWPRSVILDNVDRVGVPVARLAIPMLMFEILSRSRDGFRPTSQTERNYMVRLHGFYRRIAEHGRSTDVRHVLYENGRILAKAEIRRDALWFGAA